MRRIQNLCCAALLAGAALAIASPAAARPVSYPGGWTVMQMNDADTNSLHIHYSPTARYSVGYKGEYWRAEEWQFHGVQVNILGKRWNMPQSQANFYIKSALGAAHSNYGAFSGQTEAAGFTGIALDWENRRFLTSYENRAMYAGKIDKFFMQKARIGIAPYIGDYGDLHTWLMLQVDYNPWRKHEVTVTPLVRLFKGNYLAEAGADNNGNVLFNLIARF
ncbi:MAG: hypothetical protein GC131_05750 [Alphaproteobacteria bacterium]|nr:hypothetical protein [Alphaproteobacteria bacterium]